MVFHFDPMHPLINVKLKFTEEQLEMMNAWFDKISKPLLIIDEGPPLNVVNIENFVNFVSRKNNRFHRRHFAYPTYAQVMKAAEIVNVHELRLITRDQFLFMVNQWIILPTIKHELILAFQIFDTENRGFLEVEDLYTIVTEYGNEPFHEEEKIELLRDANVRGNGNVYYKEFVESMFSVAPELHNMPVEHIYLNPDEDPSVEPEAEAEPELPPPPPPLNPPLPPPSTARNEKKGGKKKK